MKKLIVLLIGLLVLISTPLFAEGTAEMNRLLSMLKTQKKEVVAKNIELTQKEQKDFWPLYDKYQRQLSAVDDHLAGLINDYITASGSTSEKQASELLKGYLDAEKERLRLKTSYMRMFRRILPPKKMVEYFYLESKLEAIKKIEVAVALPLTY